ncbi:hypothetical protein [Sphingomonas sp. NFX23]|uniref:hypothetical protein n=1 Tax=Sphingomonas sp. NFX23 TaxID=2819532 RepID=UPI003CEDDAD3
MKKIVMALVAMACCTAADASMHDVPGNAAKILAPSKPTPAASTNGETVRHVRNSATLHEGRALGALGVLYLSLTALGALAVMVAGYFLASARRVRRDGPSVLLFVVGFAFLVTAAFGLILLNR